MRACVLAYLATAATATRVLSGGGLPSLKPRTFGRRAVLPVPVSDKTMVVGDDRKRFLDNVPTQYRDLVAENERTGALPNNLSAEFDWPSSTGSAGDLKYYLTSEELASLGLTSCGNYRNPKTDASQLHKDIHDAIVTRKAAYKAARAAEEAAYNELKALVERAAAEAPGAEVSERTERYYAGVQRAELTAADKDYARRHGYVVRVPTETEPCDYDEFMKKALETPLNPPSKECRVDKMSSCQCELGWGLVMVIHYLAYLNAKSAADAVAMSEAIEALRNIVWSSVYQTRGAAAATRVREKKRESETRHGRDLLSFPRRSACTSSSTRARTSRSVCRSAPCARPGRRRPRRRSRGRGTATASASTSSASRCATASRWPRRPTRRPGRCRAPRSTRCSTAAGPRSRRSATA